MAYCQISIKSYFHRRKKRRWILPRLRWSSMWRSYLIYFWKGTKAFNRNTCHSKKLREIQLLGPNWLSRNTAGTAIIVSFFQLLYINFILHPYFTWSSRIPVRWKYSSFTCSFLRGRWRLTTYFVVLRMLRISHAYVLYKRGVLQNVAKFTEKHVCRSLVLKRLSSQLH